MARTETLTKDEIQHCGFCGEEISDNKGYSGYVVVGEQEEKWHVHCAENVGIPVEFDDDEHDPDFDHDPDYDGAEDANNEN
jgi:hypothetical protein